MAQLVFTNLSYLNGRALKVHIGRSFVRFSHRSSQNFFLFSSNIFCHFHHITFIIGLKTFYLLFRRFNMFAFDHLRTLFINFWHFYETLYLLWNLSDALLSLINGDFSFLQNLLALLTFLLVEYLPPALNH